MKREQQDWLLRVAVIGGADLDPEAALPTIERALKEFLKLWSHDIVVKCGGYGGAMLAAMQAVASIDELRLHGLGIRLAERTDELGRQPDTPTVEHRQVRYVSAPFPQRRDELTGGTALVSEPPDLVICFDGGIGTFVEIVNFCGFAAKYSKILPGARRAGGLVFVTNPASDARVSPWGAAIDETLRCAHELDLNVRITEPDGIVDAISDAFHAVPRIGRLAAG